MSQPPYPGQQSQPQQQPPPYGQQPEAPKHGWQPGGHLVLNLRRPMGLGSTALISPGVTIDGFPAPARWERNFYPVPAGRRTITVESRYLWPYGRQQLAVDVAPGQSVEIHYSGPMMSFGAGAMGFTEQPRPGRVAFGIILAMSLALLLIVLLLIIVSSLSS
jgi:hypothetical protein